MSLEFIQLASFYLGLIMTAGLVVFFVVNLIRGITGRAALLASLVTLAFIAAHGSAGPSPQTVTLELTAMFAWAVLLVRALGLTWHNLTDPSHRTISVVLGVGTLFWLGGSATAWWQPYSAFDGVAPTVRIVYVALLLMSVTGLVIIEQLVRNARDDLRWRIRYLNIGLGIVFGYGVVHNACAVLFNGYVPSLYVLQPAIWALAVPFLAIASLRNRENPFRMNVSRGFVFRTGVLLVTGTFLLLMGLAGYYVQLFGGDWGTAAAVFAGALGLAGFLVLVGSSRVRSAARIAIARNLYEYKYDYRDDWQNVTRRLTEPHPDFNLGQQAIRVLMDVVHTSGGAVWHRTDAGSFVPQTQLHVDWNQPLTPGVARLIDVFFAEHEWVVDLTEPSDASSKLQPLADELTGMRYLVPLLVEDRLYGIAVLNHGVSSIPLMWEDFDMLKLVARQAAGFLALEQASATLSEAHQLNALNRLSAFVVHDIKTIAAQLQLLVENAERHRDNPAFIDDMVRTTENSVLRMTKLLAQLREQSAAGPDEPVDVTHVVYESLKKFSLQTPAPTLESSETDLMIRVDREMLASVLGHMVQNAIDATPDDGKVTLRTLSDAAWAEVHIEDTGCGMETRFVEERLFQPFESTKGLTGMGIGAFQAREYLRSVGGDIAVSSSPGAGSHFILRVPRLGESP